MWQDRDLDRQLEGVFQAYRAALPDPDPGLEFSGRLWEKIDARRTFTFRMRRYASALVTASVALSLAMGAYLVQSNSQDTATYLATYAEVLNDEPDQDLPFYAELENNSQ